MVGLVHCTCLKALSLVQESKVVKWSGFTFENKRQAFGEVNPNREIGEMCTIESFRAPQSLVRWTHQIS